VEPTRIPLHTLPRYGNPAGSGITTPTVPQETAKAVLGPSPLQSQTAAESLHCSPKLEILRFFLGLVWKWSYFQSNLINPPLRGLGAR